MKCLKFHFIGICRDRPHCPYTDDFLKETAGKIAAVLSQTPFTTKRDTWILGPHQPEEVQKLLISRTGNSRLTVSLFTTCWIVPQSAYKDIIHRARKWQTGRPILTKRWCPFPGRCGDAVSGTSYIFGTKEPLGVQMDSEVVGSTSPSALSLLFDHGGSPRSTSGLQMSHL